ncbi:MAG: hypothetical protein ACXAEU_14475 [Candidatus Hodarchaeales archaeon]|jgi:CubicO group peptidase (beta-lactamase class C family)
MPFKSEAQRRFFHAAVNRGDMRKKTLNKWEEHTPKKKLPERVKKANTVIGASGQTAPPKMQGRLGGVSGVKTPTAGLPGTNPIAAAKAPSAGTIPSISSVAKIGESMFQKKAEVDQLSERHAKQQALLKAFKKGHIPGGLGGSAAGLGVSFATGGNPILGSIIGSTLGVGAGTAVNYPKEKKMQMRLLEQRRRRLGIKEKTSAHITTQAFSDEFARIINSGLGHDDR